MGQLNCFCTLDGPIGANRVRVPELNPFSQIV